MAARLVLGIDSSTQSTKALAVRPDGSVAAEGRAAIPISRPRPGFAEQDPADWWSSTVAAVRAVTAAVDPAAIEAVAISDQRETVAFLDGAGNPAAPAVVWLDRRAIDVVAAVDAAFGGRLHAVTGKPGDTNPAVYKLAWMRENQPEVLDRTSLFLDVHSFLSLRLTGTPTATWTSADPFGLFDLDAADWSDDILAGLGLDRTRLPAVVRPGSPIGRVSPEAAAETGLVAGTPLFAAGGDGQCAGLGADAVREGVVYLNLGTAVVAGLWSADKRIGRSWRTLTSPTGAGFFLESSQRAGAYLVDWVVDTFCGGRSDPAVFARLTAAAADLPVGCEGVMVCPYLLGVMDPHWNPRARATVTGLSGDHTPAHVFRATLEAITLEFARYLDALRAAGLVPREIVAIGGGARNGLWMRMVADAAGLPVVRGGTDEASALGAAITAAVGAGWHDGFAAAAAAMTVTRERIEPSLAQKPAWDRLSARQARVYEANRDL